MHIFCDVSEVAFGAVAYLRVEHQSTDKVQNSIVLLKARDALIKPLTIPKLELQATVVSVSQNHTGRIKDDVNLNNIFEQLINCFRVQN